MSAMINKSRTSALFGGGKDSASNTSSTNVNNNNNSSHSGSSSGGLSPSTSTSSFHGNNATHNNNANDLEDKYSDTSMYPSPARFDKVIPLDERYITHSTFLKNKTSETTFIGLLTNTHFYKVDPDTNKKVWGIPLVDIHTVEGDETIDPKTLRIIYHVRAHGEDGHQSSSSSSTNDTNNPDSSSSHSSSSHHGHGSSVSSKLSTLANAALKRTTENYMREKVMVAESEDIRDQWLIAIRHCTRILFQKLFESTYIPEPAIYQLHMYVYKINRKGKTQVRCILISTDRFYNISIKQSLELGKVKWSFPLAALKTLYVYKNPPNLLIVNIDNKESSKVKDHQQFITRDANERNLIVNELRRLYNKITKQHLSKEEKDENPQHKKLSLKFIANSK